MYKIVFDIIIFIFCIVCIWFYIQQSVCEKYTPETYVSKTSNESNITIVTYNIQKFPWSMKSFGDLHRLLKHYSIILLQECFDETFESLEGYFPDYHICRGTLKGINIMNSGLVILSKYPIVDVQFYLYKQSNPLTFDIFSEKGILSAQIEINGRKIYIMNTHLQSCDFYRYDRYAILQLEELKHYLTHLRLRDEKYIVGGDFNIDIQDFTRITKNKMPEMAEMSENIYHPDDPTIFIDFFTSHTRSQPEKGYEPLIFDYFISTINLGKPVTISSEYSDHNPVRTFFRI